MVKWLKKYFIPHESNNHQPHFLRSPAIKIIAGIIVFCEVIFLLQIYGIFPRSNFLALILPNVITDITNENRTTNNLLILKTNFILDEAAREKANDMATKNYFAHTSPEGLSPWYWFDRAGYKFSYAGENLAVNFVDSKDVVKAWMDSTGHRANILNQYFTEIGIGVAAGTYEGQEATFVVQLFGRPVPAQIQPIAQKSEPTITPLPKATAKPTPTFAPIIEKDNFVVVKGAEIEETPTIAVEKEQTARAAALERIVAQPKTMTKYIYLVFAGFIIISLLLAVFINIKIQYPKLVLNGVILLVLIGALIFVNHFLSLYQAKIL